MKYPVAACLMVSLLSAAAETPKSVEIRFCPASAVRTYPLESRRDLQSLLLQNVAVIICPSDFIVIANYADRAVLPGKLSKKKQGKPCRLLAIGACIQPPQASQ